MTISKIISKNIVRFATIKYCKQEVSMTSKTSTVKTTPCNSDASKIKLPRKNLNDLPNNDLSDNHFSAKKHNIESSYISEQAQIQLPLDLPIHIEEHNTSLAKEQPQDTTRSFRGCSEVSLELDFEIF